MALLVIDLAACLGIALLLLALCSTTDAQDAVRIDCGWEDNAYNDTLGLRWDKDDEYVLTGSNSRVPVVVNSSLDNSRALKTFRYFPEKRTKHCYELQTTSKTSYMIRVMFFHGSSPELKLPIQFDVSIDATIFYNVKFKDSSPTYLDTPIIQEVIVYSPGSVMNLCLIPRTGIPFISSIEVRALDAEGVMYSYEGSQTQFLLNLHRLNSGAQTTDATVRYPDDIFDRLWFPLGTGDLNLMSIDGIESPFPSSSSVNNVPPRVMKDAWVNNIANSSFGVSLTLSSGATKLYVAVYYEEISPPSAFNSTRDPTRDFQIVLNGEANSTAAVNASRAPKVKIYSNWSIGTTERTEFLFTALPSSTGGPVVNAIEVYAQYDFNFSTTAPKDVIALGILQESFNLTDWQGDPCFPMPWNWVACKIQANPGSLTGKVSKILLSSSGISGSIPTNISQLDALTEVRLDDNKLNGTVPASLVDLKFLTVLLLNDNRLSGEVPDDLKIKQGLTNFTYSGNDFAKGQSTSVGLIVGGVAGVIVAVLFLLAAGVLVWSLFFKKSRRGGKLIPEPYFRPVEGVVCHKAVLLSTGNYSNKIGVGSCGSVYHGNLDGREVVVKVNGIGSDQRTQEFLNEVDILTRVRHKNLVSLIGYCCEGPQLILIYEYEPNGTLREWLHDTNNKPLRGFLDWPQRVKIALDTARGLEYLHKYCVPPIIHRNVKTSNILLSENLEGKVTDFGVSKTILHKLKSVTSLKGFKNIHEYIDPNFGGFFTSFKGTPGYVDPEYIRTQISSPKCDVYSFGVVLAELIAGRPAFKKHFGEEGNDYLLDVLLSCAEKADINGVADPKFEGHFDKESMSRVANIAISCVQDNGEDRPSISEIVRNLELTVWSMEAY